MHVPVLRLPQAAQESRGRGALFEHDHRANARVIG
jgi:hypothetical protein